MNYQGSVLYGGHHLYQSHQQGQQQQQSRESRAGTDHGPLFIEEKVGGERRPFSLFFLVL